MRSRKKADRRKRRKILHVDRTRRTRRALGRTRKKKRLDVGSKSIFITSHPAYFRYPPTLAFALLILFCPSRCPFPLLPWRSLSFLSIRLYSRFVPEHDGTLAPMFSASRSLSLHPPPTFRTAVHQCLGSISSLRPFSTSTLSFHLHRTRRYGDAQRRDGLNPDGPLQRRGRR